jgi:hypothetical protein
VQTDDSDQAIHSGFIRVAVKCPAPSPPPSERQATLVSPAVQTITSLTVARHRASAHIFLCRR